jgi:hypothetical protein
MQMIEQDDRNLNSINGLSAQFDKIEAAHAAAEELDDKPKGKKSTSSVPIMFELESVYPNPFNSSVAINYSISEATLVSVIIFDMEGREVAKPFSGRQQPGSYKQVWEAGNLPSGLYVCKIVALGQEKSVKLNLIK